MIKWNTTNNLVATHYLLKGLIWYIYVIQYQVGWSSSCPQYMQLNSEGSIFVKLGLSQSSGSSSRIQQLLRIQTLHSFDC